MSEEPKDWLVVKRDLYWMPNDCGYTGIRDNAARYTEDEARRRVGDGLSGVSMVRLVDAPEFTNACFDDLARDHLIKKRDEALSMARDAFKAGWRTNATTEQPESYLDGCEEVDWKDFQSKGLDGYLASLWPDDDAMAA